MATVNTTWVSPVSATLDKATGATIDETMTDAWSSDLYHLGGTAGYIGCRTYNTGNLSIADSTQTALTFNTDLFDHDPNGEIHSTSSNTNRLTCRTAGVYHITAVVRWAANATGYRQVGIYHNSGTILGISTVTVVGAGAGTDMTVSCSYFLQASEYVEVIVAQTSGGALNVEAFSTSPSLSMVKA